MFPNGQAVWGKVLQTHNCQHDANLDKCTNVGKDARKNIVLEALSLEKACDSRTVHMMLDRTCTSTAKAARRKRSRRHVCTDE